MKTKDVQESKTLSTNRIGLPILFFLASLILEIANLLYLGIGCFPTYFLFDFAVISMLSALIYVFQNKHAMCVAFCILLAFQAVMGGINATLFRMFGEILSTSLVKLGGEAAAAFSFEMLDWGGLVLNLILCVLFSAIAIVLTRVNKNTYTINRKRLPFVVLAIFLVVEAGGFGLFQLQASTLYVSKAGENEIQSSDKYLWENFQFKTEAYKKFGYYGFYVKDILSHIFPQNAYSQNPQELVEYIDAGHVDKNAEAKLYGDNLIVILMESADLFSIDPIYTPTLWKLWNGYHSATFKNFYARNRTNNSEGISLLGSMPKDTSLKDAYKNDYEFQYSLPNLFKISGDENVVTNYLHPNNSTFYDRNITHASDGIGFDNMLTWEKYPCEEKFEWANWTSDKDFFEYFADTALPTDKRFLTHFSTISTHGGWTNKRSHFEKYYQAYDKSVEEYKIWFIENGFIFPKDKYNQNLLRNYKVGTMDLDATVAMILQKLEEKGLSQNTSILMFADHNAYINDLNLHMRGIEKTDFSNISVNHIPAMFYSPKLFDEKGVRIDSYCNTYDLLPTLCDLYGLPSNTNLFLGHSVFSKEIENSFFASHLGGMFTNNIYSQNITDVVLMNDKVSQEEIDKFRQNALVYFEKQEKMEKIYFGGINGTKLKRTA